MASAVELLSFFHTCGKLKDIKRRGWIRSNVPDPETVSDHTWRVAMMSILIEMAHQGEEKLNVCKMLKMALLHDLAEVETGDITPTNGISKSDKDRLERGAMKKILLDVDENNELLNIWEEYNTGETQEAKLVLALDKLEMAVTAKEYEARGTNGLDEFYKFEPAEFPKGPIRDIYQLLIMNESK